MPFRNFATRAASAKSFRWEIANLDGIATDSSGQPLCSSEFVTILTKPRRGNGGTTNLIVRGLQDIGRGLRSGFKIVRGRDVRTGVNEAITSERMAERFQNLAIGESWKSTRSTSRSSATLNPPAVPPNPKSGPISAT